MENFNTYAAVNDIRVLGECQVKKTTKPHKPFKLPGNTVGDEDLKQFQGFVNKISHQTARKLNNLGYRGPKDKDVSLNILGITLEDIKQEMLLQVFLAITAYNEFRAKNPKTIDDEQAAFGAFVWKFLENRSVLFIRDMWRDKHGQEFKHVSGPAAELFFAGGSLTEMEESLLKLKEKFNGSK